MENWTYFATYASSDTETRALPASFSELLINGEFLVPWVAIENISSINQALILVYQPNIMGDNAHPAPDFRLLQIWSSGLRMILSPNYTQYDVYYR